MTDVFYVKEAIFSRKSHERIIAIVDFWFTPVELGPRREGILKIAGSEGSEKVDYFILTFLVDTQGDQATREFLTEIFQNLGEGSLRPFFSRQFVKLMKFPLEQVVESQEWYFQELNIYFKSIKKRESAFVENKLMSALAAILPFSFGHVELWPEDHAKTSKSADLARAKRQPRQSFVAMIKKWARL
ncbi:MAG: hypothetical protein JRJ12_11285 [Deltaproteobacteria bacterium]|nr:hypothetical protein [Deltaproteobacteria bacterium]MBW2071854.1 hypothetical protein [Deltaproteobacteria bacterium]